MGQYLETGTSFKANILIDVYGAENIRPPKTLKDIPEGKQLVIIVDNGPFEAAAHIDTEDEYVRWEACRYMDPRKRYYLLVDKEVVEQLKG